MWLAAGCSSRGFTMKKNGAFAVKIMEYDGGWKKWNIGCKGMWMIVWGNYSPILKWGFNLSINTRKLGNEYIIVMVCLKMGWLKPPSLACLEDFIFTQSQYSSREHIVPVKCWHVSKLYWDADEIFQSWPCECQITPRNSEFFSPEGAPFSTQSTRLDLPRESRDLIVTVLASSM